MALLIPHSQLDAVLRHGEQTYPNECCGLLLGSVDASGRRCITGIQHMRNANTASPRNRFDFDPHEHLEAQRAARERGVEIVGFYHSHPDHPARPSQFDLDHAAWPGYSYLIVAIHQGKRIAEDGANSFELAEDRSQFLQEIIQSTQEVL
ncbi:MAG: Mov34/MPN/PAD-1 family protein [Terriglobales bacterium]